MDYTEISCESACNKLKRKIPYGWDKDKLYEMVNEMKQKYDFSGSYSSIMKEKLKSTENEQISLFG